MDESKSTSHSCCLGATACRPALLFTAGGPNGLTTWFYPKPPVSISRRPNGVAVRWCPRRSRKRRSASRTRSIFLHQPRRDDAFGIAQGMEGDPALKRGGKRNDLLKRLSLRNRKCTPEAQDFLFCLSFGDHEVSRYGIRLLNGFAVLSRSRLRIAQERPAV